MLSLSRQWSSPHWPQGHGNCVYVSVSQLAVERKKEDGVSLSILFSFFVIVSACEVACFCNLIYSAKHTLFYAWWLFCTVWVHYLQMACCFFSLFYFAQYDTCTYLWKLKTVTHKSNFGMLVVTRVFSVGFPRTRFFKCPCAFRHFLVEFAHEEDSLKRTNTYLALFWLSLHVNKNRNIN